MKDAYFAVNSINGENLPVPEIIDWVNCADNDLPEDIADEFREYAIENPDLAEGIKVLQGSFYIGDESCPLTIEF